MLDALRLKLWIMRDAMRERRLGKAHRQAAFQKIYASNSWGDSESVSGTGSNLEATENIRRELPLLCERFGIRSIIDAPCGDFFWMKLIAGSFAKYLGVDIVPELIAKNQALYASATIQFQCADLTSERLPSADALLCRDCFIHLPTRTIALALHNFKASGVRYLFLTQIPGAPAYADIAMGSFRPIDFTRPPFNFPPPLATIQEDASGKRTLGMWELSAVPLERIG